MTVQKPLVTEAGTTQQLQAGDQIEVNAGTAAAPALTIDGDDNTGIYSPGADQLSISTGGTQRVTVDASGNVLIPGKTSNTTIAAGSNGAALPQATINVVDTSTFSSSGTLFVATSAGTQTVTYSGTTATSFTGCSGGTGTMSTSGFVRQYMGDVGVGTATPNTTMEVVSVAPDGGVRVTGTVSNITPTYYVRMPNGGYGRTIWENAAGTDQWVYYASTDGSGAQQSWALNDAVALKDRLTIWGGANLALGMIVNTGQADYDFRIKGTTDANLFVADAGANAVGIGTATPATPLDVRGTVRSVVIPGANSFVSTDLTQSTFVVTHAPTDQNQVRLSTAGTNQWLSLANGAGSDVLNVRNDRVGIGDTNPAYALTVKSGSAGIAFDPTTQSMGSTFGTGGNFTWYAETPGSVTGPNLLLGGSTRGDAQKNALVYGVGANEYFRVDGDATGHTLGNVVIGLSASGTATSVGAFTLTDINKSWATNQFSGATLRITAGTGAGQTRTVASNTSNTLTVSVAWSIPQPDATSYYTVIAHSTNVGIGTSLPSAKLDVQAGTLAADGSTSSVKSTSTLPASPSTTIIGNDFTITGAGSSANDFYALRAGVFEGYTGSAGSYGALLFNNSKSTATFSHLGAVKGTAALWGEVAVTAPAPFTGYGIGAYYNVGGGTKNIGVLSRVVYNAGATADTSIGVWGGVDRATHKIGVYASIGTGGSPGDSQAIPTGTAALIADNTNEAAPIFLARDNGTEVVRIADGGAVTIGTTGTSYTLPTADGATNQVLQTNGAGAVSWQTVAAASASLTGNMVWVDAVYGNDATGTRNDDGKPFLTVEAALAAALSGDVVTLRPGTYNVATTLTLPTGVALRGYNRDNTTIQKLNVTADTTLLTMGESSSIQDLRFRLTSTGHHTLKGVLWSGTTTATAHADHVYIDVDNSTAGDVGTSNVYGVHVTATSTPARITSVASNDVIVNATSAGLGNKRGVLLDTSIAYFRNESCIYSAVRTGVAAGSYIGGEVNIASGILAMNAGGYEGTSADMSQTAGSLEVLGVDLTNDNANGKGFLVTQASPRFTWGVVGPLPGGTRYLYPGTANASGTEIFTRLAAKGIMKSLTVRVRVPPGVGQTDVYTLRKNGVNTALTVSLSDTNVWAEILTASVSFAATDDLSIAAVTAGGSVSADIIIVAEIY